MTQIALYGAPYSVYVRIARLVLHEIGVNYDLVPIDIFTPDSLPADYAARHPFAKIPAFEHDGFRLFETDAIARYAVAAFGGDSLIPRAARAQARMTQIMRIMDHYAYPVLVWGVFVEEVERGRAGQLSTDEMDRAQPGESHRRGRHAPNEGGTQAARIHSDGRDSQGEVNQRDQPECRL